MPEINPISRKELISKLKTLDFEGPFRATRHQYMIKKKHNKFSKYLTSICPSIMLCPTEYCEIFLFN